MNESYVELMVKRKTSLGALVGRNIFIGLGALSFLLGLLSGGLMMLFIMFAIICGLLAYILHLGVYTEFEYLYVDKTLSVDKIRNMSSRKTVAEYQISNMELLAPVSSDRMKAYEGRKDVKTVDYSAKDAESGPYAMVIREGNLVTVVLIEMNDELFDQIRKVAPRNVYRD